MTGKSTNYRFTLVFILIISYLQLSFPFPAHCESDSEVRNVIIMIADGAGFNHFLAAEYYLRGNRNSDTYRNFPIRIAVNTCSDLEHGYDPGLAAKDREYPRIKAVDSAAAATAMSTGRTTYDSAIGVDRDKQPVKHLLEYAKEAGKSTGVTTSVQFSHGTPAGFTVHNTSRNNYEQIASDMILSGNLDLIIGCGHPEYDTSGVQVPDTTDGEGRPLRDYRYVGGREMWENLRNGSVIPLRESEHRTWKLMETPEEFRALALATPTDHKNPSSAERCNSSIFNYRIIGVPRVKSTLQLARSGDMKAPPETIPFIPEIPNLSELSMAALNYLSANPKGFFLMVEGGAIDWASHDNMTGRMIEEMSDFIEAVDAVTKWLNETGRFKDTLLIVTSDHETGYLTGPGWGALQDAGPGKLPEMEWHSLAHTNSLVPLFAKGKGAVSFLRYVHGQADPKYGPFIHSTDIFRVIFDAMFSRKNAG